MRIPRIDDGLRVLLSGFVLTGLLTALASSAQAEIPRVLPEGQLPDDARLGDLRDLNSYFPFTPPKTVEEWLERRKEVKDRMLVACGLLPMPSRPPIEATVHGRVDREGYTVDRVFFESSPGLLVTGSLYRPKGRTGRLPTVICPHGHWTEGRFHDWGEGKVKTEIEVGAEKFANGGRHPLQARCVQLTRMGCNVFLYDMQGYADGGSLSYQLIHRFDSQRPELSTPERWGLFSAQSELRLLNALGLQTWNSVRILDWLETQPWVDRNRIAVTGASGGGTQTFMIGAIDDRIAAAFPAVMVSTAMQGGCTCENATYLRIGTGNIEFAAMMAPRPVAMSGARDWTVDIETKGLPDLKKLYELFRAPDNVQAKFFAFPHNYNMTSRSMMYDFFNRHLKLGTSKIEEQDYVPLSVDDATVFSDAHPAPKKTDEAEVAILKALDDDLQQVVASLKPHDATSYMNYRKVIFSGFKVLIGRDLPPQDSIEYDKKAEVQRDGYLEYTALLKLKARKEELPTVFFYPKEWNGEVVIWVGENGKSELFNDDGSLIEPAAKLVQAGFSIASADLLYQGEFLKDGKPLTQARRVKNTRQFAGYTYGYNHPLFAQRVHDVLTLLSFVKFHGEEPQKVHLAGFGQGGIVAAAACARSSQAIDSLAVSTGGFRFGSITDIRDVNLLPGAVRYGDVPGILSLIVNTDLWLAGEDGEVPSIVRACWDSIPKSGDITAHAGPAAGERAAAAAWLIGRHGQ